MKVIPKAIILILFLMLTTSCISYKRQSFDSIEKLGADYSFGDSSLFLKIVPTHLSTFYILYGKEHHLPPYKVRFDFRSKISLVNDFELLELSVLDDGKLINILNSSDEPLTEKYTPRNDNNQYCGGTIEVPIDYDLRFRNQKKIKIAAKFRFQENEKVHSVSRIFIGKETDEMTTILSFQ